MNNRKIMKTYGKCEVTITFNGTNNDSLERVKWLLIESYCDRVKRLTNGKLTATKEKIKVS